LDYHYWMTRRRIARVREDMRDLGLDALIVSSLSNIRFLSGFSGSNALSIITSKEIFFITDSRYALQSKDEVKRWRRFITTRSLAAEASQQALLAGCRRVGFESHYVTHAQYRAFKKLFPRKSFVPTEEIVENIALVKDQEELGSIREAVAISDRVFTEVIKCIRPGVTELDVAAEISYLHKRNGAEHDAFEPIVASGERAAFPHARATSRRIKRGDMVVLDFGCACGGYHSDITRTIAVGRVLHQGREIYHVVLDAQQEAIMAAKGGMLAKELDGIARKLIASRGYGRYFTHSLGHGLGLRAHERPRVSALSNERLQAGSVITIEPGVYLPGVGGVRIEDDVLLTSTGCEVLNTAPKELMIV